jgi:hypothetical protein
MPYTPEIGRRFWFEFDKRTNYDDDFMSLLAGAGAFDIQKDFFSTRKNHTYPKAFQSKFQPHKNEWSKVVALQTDVIGTFLGADWSDIQAAFEDFGQGTLLDTDPVRKQTNNSIHMMDVQDATQPPVGYHRWHASIRAIQLMKIGDASWWEKLDSLVGLAWAIQSFARPLQQDVANPAIAKTDLQELRDAWLGLSPDARDRQYDSTGHPFGYHPAPKLPVA